MIKNIDRAIEALEKYQEDGDGYIRYFHGASREALTHIQQHGFVGRVAESDLQYSNGNADCIYVAPFATIEQCFEYAGERGVIYVWEYSQIGEDDVLSNGSGSEYLLPIKSPSFWAVGYYDLLTGEFSHV